MKGVGTARFHALLALPLVFFGAADVGENKQTSAIHSLTHVHSAAQAVPSAVERSTGRALDDNEPDPRSATTAPAALRWRTSFAPAQSAANEHPFAAPTQLSNNSYTIVLQDTLSTPESRSDAGRPPAPSHQDQAAPHLRAAAGCRRVVAPFLSLPLEKKRKQLHPYTRIPSHSFGSRDTAALHRSCRLPAIAARPRHSAARSAWSFACAR